MEDRVGYLRGLLAEAVQGALAAAVSPAAICLSGGIDSSTVAALAPGVAAFTGYYADGPAYDEREYARLLAPGRAHHEILITPEDFLEHFDGCARVLKPPYQGPGAFGQYMVARAAAAHGYKTLLSGEGGDELFGGYARLHIVAGLPPPPGYEDYVLPPGYPADVAGALAYDWGRLPALLACDDQVCRAWGITCVAPMLDDALVAWVHLLPPEERVGKRLLRAAMAGLVPPAVLGREDKRGFPVPYVKWANEHPHVRAWFRERLGYLPDPAQPWARGWWLDLLERSG